MLQYTAVLTVGIYGPMLPFVADAAADPPPMEQGPSWGDFSDGIEALAVELDPPFNEVTGRIANTEITAASASAIEFAVYDDAENAVGSGAFTSYDFVDGEAVTTIEFDAGTTNRAYQLSAYIEDGKVVLDGTIVVTDSVLQTVETYTGKGWIENGEFVTTPETDVDFARNLAALGGYTGEDPEQLAIWLPIVAGLVILILGVALCKAIFDDCGFAGNWLTRVGQWLQNILL